ncbi:hypothetical protein Y032_0802g2428 [Ancylostoma ceylanicum]|uniref:Ionotropic glutamate receptor L-glutamate and glycine-binding domain-containing protein n=1 Tax=Ancylostoma ceylanicum TaxID=53326 RepID=A0A016WE92_9BILA|nr:hypothetical protein Y032_0802g2428 [Ancylostoma ceylanicum]
MHFRAEILLVNFLIYAILNSSTTSETIGFLSEEHDDDAETIFRHLNVSLMYYADNLKLDNITVKHVVITKTTFTSALCGLLTNVSFLISVCKSEKTQQLVLSVSQLSGLPTIQIVRGSWNTQDSSSYDATPVNHIYVVPTETVFNNVILDVFPDLNIATEVTVLFDSIYGSDDNLRNVFKMLPVPVSFTQLETNQAMLQQQVRYLQATDAKNVIIVAETANTEIVVKEDVTPFRCEECLSVNLVWIRPYATGKISSTRDLREFLVKTEAGLELNYSIKSWIEVEVAFYFNVMGFVFDFITQVHSAQTQFNYVCGSEQAAPYLTVKNVILENPTKEYGTFLQHGTNTFYQDVEAKIFRIERSLADPDGKYNKEIAYWTNTAKITLLYGKFDIDIKSMTDYRVVTLIQPPFVQLSGNPKKPYEGYCIDLIELIRDEVCD